MRGLTKEIVDTELNGTIKTKEIKIMSELIHRKDNGIMMPDRIKDYLKCSKCGFIVRKNHIHYKYEQGVLEIPI